MFDHGIGRGIIQDSDLEMIAFNIKLSRPRGITGKLIAKNH